MRLSEKQLRLIIKSSILSEKNKDRIYNKIIHRATTGGQEAATVSDIRSAEEKRLKSLNPQELNTTYAYRDADERRVANEKELKRIWAEEVEAEDSRSFFDETLIRVHWIGGYTGGGKSTNPFKTAIKFLESQPKGRIRDEISCFGYTPSQGIDHKPTSVGVIIKGYTTYVSAVDAATHMTSRATDVERRKHSGSGLHKRPLMNVPDNVARNMIVDEESWASATREYHEVIVDNWKVEGIIIPSFQSMVDQFKRKISDFGRERRGSVDKMVEEAKSDLQELGRLAAGTGIPFYDDKLQPFDFSGKEFEAGELGSEWDKVISPVGNKIEGIATGDPDVPEVVIEGKEVNLQTDGFSKSITFKNCELKIVEFINLRDATVRIEECGMNLVGASFQSGEGSIELINPRRRATNVISIWPNFKLRSAKFVGCNFEYELVQKLREQRDKNGSIITFENCENLPPEAEGWQNPPAAKQLYYHGPGREGVTQLSADDIARMVLDIRSFDHKVYVDGSWRDAFSVPEVQDSFKRLVPPPPPPRAISERLLRRIIREELDSSDDRAIVVLGNTSTGPVYVIAYDKRELESSLDDRRDPWERYEARNTPNYSGVIAGLTLKKTDEYGECNDAWQVSTSVSNERGWGTKVYLAAFEWLRNISSDRYSVSASAEGMWKSLARRGIIEPEPFDDFKDPKTPPTSDDCRVFKLRDPVLNSSFRLVGSIPSDVSQLLEAGEEHLRDLERSGTKNLVSMALRGGLGDLFVNIYEG